MKTIKQTTFAGFLVESSKDGKSYVTQLKDAQGNQLGDALHSGTRKGMAHDHAAKVSDIRKQMFRRADSILLEAGGRVLWVLDGPPDINPCKLKMWSVMDGLVLLQYWEDGGVSAYWDKGLGETWEDLKLRVCGLEKPTPVKTPEEIRATIKKIRTDYAHVLTGKVDNIVINAPRALMQLEAETKLKALHWVLGEVYQSELKQP